MNGFKIMLKTNLKLLLRNKGYLSFLVILPLLSVIVLNIKNMSYGDAGEKIYVIHELQNANKLIVNVSNSKMNVKIYDCSKSKLSDYIAKELAKTGAYHVFRYRGEEASQEEMEKQALYSANHNKLGAVIYIPQDFETQILEGGKSGNITVYKAAADGRIELLKNNMNAYVQSLDQYAAAAGYEKNALYALLDQSEENELHKEIVKIEVGEQLNLTAEQTESSSAIGLSLSLLTICFLFSGVFIAATVVEERNNRVYNRIRLSMLSLGCYGLVKLVMVFTTVLIQTGLIAIGIKLFVKTNFGISFISYLFLVFCLGMIFNLLSVVIGVLAGNVLTSNYIAFLLWCMSSLIAGLYFPLDEASVWWTRISMLMPQKWVIKASELLMAGKSGVYSMYLLVVCSYLIVIASIGFIGIKIRNRE